MDSEHVEILLAEAVGLPRDQRAEYLDRECQSAEVRREVERLLLSYDAGGADFLESPVLLLNTEVLSRGWEQVYLDIGQSVGPYRIEQLIAEGGMGVVYLASRVDDAFHKLVAIKLIQKGLETDEALHRFRNERQILATLEHPNIARLYDGGATKDDRPYLVMEYVEGQRIDDYCQEQELSIEERLELFREVCSAVSHAHRNLLVHRDLKPSNILVTDEGIPKLLDFGIAKSLAADTGQAVATRPGQRPMTPAYASPEQIRGETAITTASDVYGLGVVLYELLTGRPPYQLGDDSDVTLQSAILHQEPTKPSTMVAVTDGPPVFQRRLKGDLDTILLKALRKEPERRYASVQAFSDDIGRFLDNLPVEASGDALSYRVGKFVRRHRAGLAVAVVFVVVVAGFIAALIHQARVATEERDKARAQTEIAERQRERAERTTDAFKDALKGSDPEIARGADITAREILDSAAGKIRTTLKEEPDILAELLTTMGELYVSLGEFQQAGGLLSDALEMRRGTEEEGQSLYHLGELEWSRREYALAEGFYRQALAVLRAETVEHAQATRGLGVVLAHQGRGSEAEAHLNGALVDLQNTLDETDPEILEILFGLGIVARDRGNYARAEKLFRQVVEIRRQSPAGPALGRALAELGMVRFQQGELEEARRSLEEAIPLIALAGETTYLAEVLGKLVAVLIPLGADEEAETLIRRILETAPEDHPAIGHTLHNLALIYDRRGEHARASDVLKKALAAKQTVFGNNHITVAVSLCLLGRITLDRNLPSEALDHYRECEAVYTAIEHSNRAFAWIGFGRVHEILEGCGEAASWYSKAFELQRQTLGEGHYRTAETGVLLGSCLVHTGEVDEARALLVSGFTTLEQELGETNQRVVEAKRRLDLFEGERRPP